MNDENTRQRKSNLQYSKLTLLITIAAALIAENMTLNELEVLAVAVTQMGDTFATIAAQKAILEPDAGSSILLTRN